MPDEIEIIDFIEADPNAFSARDASADRESVPPPPGHRRRRIVAIAIASVAAVVATAVAWSPWRDDDRIALPHGDAPELTLADRLVFDDPPAELTAASLGDADEERAIAASFADTEGYFFAEPGASWDFNRNGTSVGTWAGFVAIPVASENAPELDDLSGSTSTVQGAPALFSSASGGAQGIRFGPVDGWIFDVVTSGMPLAESMAFAEAVGVANGEPVLTRERVLGQMLPLGDIHDYAVAVATSFAALSPFLPQPEVVSSYYGEFNFAGEGDNPTAFSIATQPVHGAATLAMLRFLLAGESDISVHGQPAITAHDVQTGFGLVDATNSIVAWVEGGRLIVVTGSDDEAATLALAESVRPATDDEWARVVEESLEPAIR